MGQSARDEQGEPTQTWQLHLSRFPQRLRYRIERYILEWNHAHPADPLTKRDVMIEAIEEWLTRREGSV